MLHTLHRSPWLTDFAALLRLLSEGDELLLLQDGVTAAVDGNDIILIDYTDFVRLTVKHSSQMAW